MKRTPINFDWKRMLGEPPMGPVHSYQDVRTVDLPDDYILEQPRAAENPGGAPNAYFPGGSARYEKVFEFDPSWEGQTVLLDLDGSYMNTEIYLNRSKIGYHPYAYSGYLCDMTGDLLRGENTLLILTQARQPSTRWYSGGGIFREAAIWTGGRVHIRPWDLFITTPTVTAEKAVAHIEALVTNTGADCEADITFSVKDPSGQTVGTAKAHVALGAASCAQATAEIAIAAPQLWDTDTPALYSCEAVTVCEGAVTDNAEAGFGIRTFEMTAKDGFVLNGKRIKLRGGCIHHDNGPIGARAMPAAEERKLRILKEAGFNAVRSAHNPPSTALLNAADRLGMLVLDESFDCWVEAKPALDYHLYFEDWWERDTTAMVKRDRNHPSVWAYSIGNEIVEFFGRSNGKHWAAVQAECVRRNDPTRPVTAAMVNLLGFEEENKDTDGDMHPPMLPYDLTRPAEGYLQPGDRDSFYDGVHEAAEVLDVVGYNYSFRRFGYDRIMHPDRPVVGFESNPVDVYDTWKAVEDNDNVLGDFVWTAFDNMGEAGVGRPVWDLNAPFEFMGPYPWLTCNQGDHDLCGGVRPQGAYRRLLWKKESGVRLYMTRPENTGKTFWGAGWHWEDVTKSFTFDGKYIGKNVHAVVYTDAERVEFLLNGKRVGESGVVRLCADCTFAYESGVLEAVGYRDGRECGRDRIETNGAPVGIRLLPEKTVLKADGMDLAYVTAELYDAEGRRVYAHDLQLSANVGGAGTMLGLGSADPCTAENYGTGKRITYDGRVLIVVRAARTAGECEVCVTAPGFSSARTILRCE